MFRSRGRVLLAAGLAIVAGSAVAAVFAFQRHTAFDALPDGLPHSPHALVKGDPDAHPTVAPKTRNLGGPDSYAAQQIAALAYPSDTLTAAQLDRERAVYLSSRNRTRGFTGPLAAFSLAGPRTGVQPGILNFFDSQASAFKVSGRVTAMAVNPTCDLTTCMLWIAAAGGGIWRTPNALASTPSWTYLSGGFGTNAIGALTYYEPTHTLYAGTGEPNASGDSEAGVGIYSSTNNGTDWTLLPGSPAATNARSISSIVVDPNNSNTIYVGTTRGVRGVSAVTGGALTLAPDAPAWGLWKTTNGGTTFAQVWDGNGTLRGVNHVEIDSHGTIYAAAFQQGIWRSSNGGSTWEQVFATQDPTNNSARTEFALNTLNGNTRIYVGDGGEETDTQFPPHSNSGVYRGDGINTKTSAELTDGTSNPGFVSLTPASLGRTAPTYDYCEGQCWYDNFVVSPAGSPDVVYVGGSFDYNLYSYPLNHGRGVLLSQNAGSKWTDQSRDTGSPTTNIHPDQHALVVDPANPLLFFEGSDGGVIHSSGSLANASADCLTGTSYTASCQKELSAVPTKLTPMNAGLSTLQFQGIANHGTTVIGGTQDNGTWLGTSGASTWDQTIYGDGGVAAFDASNLGWSMNEFYGSASDVNFENGAPSKWVIATAPLAISGEGSEFYKPQIGDPKVSGTAFIGMQSVWRTKNFGGNKAYLEKNCPEFTTPFDTPGCGDFVAIGNPSDLTASSTSYGSDRAGGYVTALARTTADSSTLWAATATGRVFISKNASTAPGSVVFTRIDNTSAPAPGRFVSGIVVGANNPNRAWITYSGYDENTLSTPGHVFQVNYNPSTHQATWTRIDNGSSPLGDLPATSIARDSNGTLYVGTDFQVYSSPMGAGATYSGDWGSAGTGMPQVEITDLKVNDASHRLYVATHGRAIWSLPIG
jgi:hypothetical protein